MVHTPFRSARTTPTRATAALGALALAAAVSTALGAPAHAAATASTTLVVNANQPFRSVTHVASGSLYGLANASTPADSLVTPLHPNTFVQMAPGGSQLPNGEPAPAGDALVVAAKAANAGAKVIVRMPDWYPNFPYKWVSWSNWLSAVDTQIASVKSSGAGNIEAYELWNEPDWTWDTTNAGSFDAGWVTTYQEVRAKDATTPIDGPSYSAWNLSWMTQFLTYAKAHNAVPDIVSWHELQGAQNIAADVAAYRNLETSLGISPRPIAIEEYGTTSEVGVPGPWPATSPSSSERGCPMPNWPSGTSTAPSVTPSPAPAGRPTAPGGCTSGTATCPAPWSPRFPRPRAASTARQPSAPTASSSAWSSAAAPGRVR